MSSLVLAADVHQHMVEIGEGLQPGPSPQLVDLALGDGALMPVVKLYQALGHREGGLAPVHVDPHIRGRCSSSVSQRPRRRPW